MFFVAAADAEDNATLTPQLSNPDSDNLNLICAGESASLLENICVNWLRKINRLHQLVRQT